MDELREQATDLLWTVWRGIPPDYKSRYRRNIWQQFEDRVRSAAYTSNLGKFVNSLCLSLGATVGRASIDRETADKVLNSGNDAILLKLLRDETTLIVLKVRLRNEQAQQVYKERRATEAGPIFKEMD